VWTKKLNERRKNLFQKEGSPHKKYLKSRSEEDKPPSPNFSWAFNRAGDTKKSRADCPAKWQSSSADREIGNS